MKNILPVGNFATIFVPSFCRAPLCKSWASTITRKHSFCSLWSSLIFKNSSAASWISSSLVVSEIRKRESWKICEETKRFGHRLNKVQTHKSKITRGKLKKWRNFVARSFKNTNYHIWHALNYFTSLSTWKKSFNLLAEFLWRLHLKSFANCKWINE